MKAKLPLIGRILLGLIFFVFGLNGFLNFIPQPPPPPAAGAFFGAIIATGYLWPLIKGTEVVAGLMLLSGRGVPLALTLLAPIIVNILFFHTVLAPAGAPMAIVITALNVALAYAYRDSFRGVLNFNAKPTAQSANEATGTAATHAAE